MAGEATNHDVWSPGQRVQTAASFSFFLFLNHRSTIGRFLHSLTAADSLQSWCSKLGKCPERAHLRSFQARTISMFLLHSAFPTLVYRRTDRPKLIILSSLCWIARTHKKTPLKQRRQAWSEQLMKVSGSVTGGQKTISPLWHRCGNRECSASGNGRADRRESFFPTSAETC